MTTREAKATAKARATAKTGAWSRQVEAIASLVI
jgi:hypothetical protein